MAIRPFTLRAFPFVLLLSRSPLAGSPLTFEEILARATIDPAAASGSAWIARLEREIATTGSIVREGPTLTTETGPRRAEDGGTSGDVTARLDVPLLSTPRVRDDAAIRLREAKPVLVAAWAVESRLRIRNAYLDAWAAQERLVLERAQVDLLERSLGTVASRVEAGAAPPYEIALVEGELLRTRSEADHAIQSLGDAWGALRVLTEIPPTPEPLAAPRPPDLTLEGDRRARFESGVLRRAVTERASLDSAFQALELARSRSRFSVGSAVGKEGADTFATVGVGLRLPRRGETVAFERESDLLRAAIARAQGADVAAIETRFESAVRRAREFGAPARPETFEEALGAIFLRIELGKDRPSEALPVRRQLLEARHAALARVRDACALAAEIEALTAGGAP